MAPFEHDDLELVRAPPASSLARRAHPRRVTTDHHQPFRHRRRSPFRAVAETV